MDGGGPGAGLLGALWALGLRTEAATEAAVEQAIADRTIIRTWPMRGTLHFVAPADVRWMLALLAPGVVAGQRSRHAARYFTSHGPATVHGFAWWSGLTVADARKGIELARTRLERDVVDDRTYWLAARAPGKPAASPKPPAAWLLPPFDEYIVAYKDRSAVHDASAGGLISSNGIFYPTIVLDGRVAGTWKRSFKKDAVVITLSPFTPLKKKERQAVAGAAERYGAFLGRPIILEL